MGTMKGTEPSPSDALALTLPRSFRGSRSAVTRAEAPSEPQAPSMADLSTQSIDRFLEMLDGVEPPPSVMNLKAAVQAGDEAAMAEGMYLLLIDQSLDYDIGEDGSVTKTKLDLSDTSDEAVKEKFRYVYSYGITMLSRGMIAQEPLQKAVLEKLAGRVGMDGPEFDKWLQMPAVPV